MTGSVARLARALDFLDACRSDRTSSDTGALRDALQGLEESAREVVREGRKVDAVTEYYRDRVRSPHGAGIAQPEPPA